MKEQETVTITLERFKMMENQIKDLQEEVKKKTVIKYMVSPWILPVMMILVLIIVVYLKILNL